MVQLFGEPDHTSPFQHIMSARTSDGQEASRSWQGVAIHGLYWISSADMNKEYRTELRGGLRPPSSIQAPWESIQISHAQDDLSCKPELPPSRFPTRSDEFPFSKMPFKHVHYEKLTGDEPGVLDEARANRASLRAWARGLSRRAWTLHALLLTFSMTLFSLSSWSAWKVRSCTCQAVTDWCKLHSLLKKQNFITN